jgi:protein transport protein SEC61 subunit alpha
MILQVFFFSQLLWRRFTGNIVVGLLGKWVEIEGRQSVPVGGLVYYLVRPLSIQAYVLFQYVLTMRLCYL